MSLLDSFLGRTPGGDAPHASSEDERAVERYRYLLRTAPPDDIERAHAEAFAKLAPEERALLLRQLAHVVPASESNAAKNGDALELARLATRAEVRSPGTLERTFAGSMLPAIAGAVIGTTMAHALIEGFAGDSDDHVSEFEDAEDASFDDGGFDF